MTLDELRKEGELAIILKETSLGLRNGAFTGITAAIGIYVFASIQNGPAAFDLGAVVFLAMSLSCLISHLFGAVVPLSCARWVSIRPTPPVYHRDDDYRCQHIGGLLGWATWLI